LIPAWGVLAVLVWLVIHAAFVFSMLVMGVTFVFGLHMMLAILVEGLCLKSDGNAGGADEASSIDSTSAVVIG
jgi:hypothetical protein